MIAKEGRDVETAYFPGFFLKTEKFSDAEDLILKITGAVALFLVNSDEGKWRKNLRREKGKWVAHVMRNK